MFSRTVPNKDYTIDFYVGIRSGSEDADREILLSRGDDVGKQGTLTGPFISLINSSRFQSWPGAGNKNSGTMDLMPP